MTTQHFVRIATLALVALTLFATSSFAANYPLNSPVGLAVDAKSNLYVGNSGANQILVYNSGYAQQKSKTITAGVNGPAGLAFDPFGNLWVANENSGNLTLYTNGVQNTAATISGFYLPTSIATDGLGDLYVVSLDRSTFAYFITVYSPADAFAIASQLVQTSADITLSGNGGMAVAGPALYYSNGNGTTIATTSKALRADDFSGGAYGAPVDGWSLGADSSGNMYIGDNDNSVYVALPGGHANVFIANLGFVPEGIAVDNVKKRVYISDNAGNQIVVYSTAGVLLHTIHN